MARPQRVWSLVVDRFKVQSLDVEFRVERSLKPEQNTAEIAIFNLSLDHRKTLQQKQEGVIVELRAGYLGFDPTKPQPDDANANKTAQPALLFLGRLREISSTQSGSTWTTVITSGDGDEERDHAIDFSLGPGASLKTAIQRVLGEMRTGIGNAADLIGGSKVFSSGTAINGQAFEELQRLYAMDGKEVSIQSGKLQVQNKGKALATQAVLVTDRTGLIGSPEPGNKGVLQMRTLLNPEIYPGRQLKVRSQLIDGYYRCERAVFTGATRGLDWYTDTEANPIQ